jgi:hypothetical protein
MGGVNGNGRRASAAARPAPRWQWLGRELGWFLWCGSAHGGSLVDASEVRGLLVNHEGGVNVLVDFGTAVVTSHTMEEMVTALRARPKWWHRRDRE